jgi:glutathione synthase/RimK-type ligase-like ATP-grasp enzyme
MTLAEDTAASSGTSFAVLHRVDEHDCLEFARALRNRGHDVYFVNWRDIDMNARRITRAFMSNRGEFHSDIACSDFDLVFVYKMEGFLRDQARFFDMVDLFEQCCRAVVNAPATIRSNIDKGYLFELAANKIPVIPSYRLVATHTASRHPDTHDVDSFARDLHARGKSAVIKPLRAERGDGIFKLDAADDVGDWQTALSRIDLSQYLAQEYVPSIRDGERSLAYLGHDFQHGVIKYPNPRDPREFRCNESLGGKVARYTPTAQELDIANRVLASCEALGWPVHFSRVDLVPSPQGPLLMEAELLNPSVYANYAGRGQAFGEALADHFSSLLSVD